MIGKSINSWKRMYVIFDKVAQEASSINYANNDEEALRQFNQALSKSPCPEDFDLYYLGDICLSEPAIEVSSLDPCRITAEKVVRDSDDVDSVPGGELM